MIELKSENMLAWRKAKCVPTIQPTDQQAAVKIACCTFYARAGALFDRIGVTHPPTGASSLIVSAPLRGSIHWLFHEPARLPLLQQLLAILVASYFKLGRRRRVREEE